MSNVGRKLSYIPNPSVFFGPEVKRLILKTPQEMSFQRWRLLAVHFKLRGTVQIAFRLVVAIG